MTDRRSSASIPVTVAKPSGPSASPAPQEKDLNLAISLYLRDALLQSGLRVMMTRETDVAVDLHDRAAMANQAKANLFVCVHNNAASDGESNGTETFYWGDATSGLPDGKALAECHPAAPGGLHRLARPRG